MMLCIVTASCSSWSFGSAGHEQLREQDLELGTPPRVAHHVQLIHDYKSELFQFLLAHDETDYRGCPLDGANDGFSSSNPWLGNCPRNSPHLHGIRQDPPQPLCLLLYKRHKWNHNNCQLLVA